MICAAYSSDAGKGREYDGGKDKDNIQEIQVSITIPEDNFKSAEQRRSDRRVPLVELRFDRARGGERYCFATKPGEKDKRAHDSYGVIRSHPHLSTGITLCETITGGEVGNPFVHAGEDKRGEAETDLLA